MRLVLNWHTFGSETGAFATAARAIRRFICGSGMVLTLGLSGCAGKPAPGVQYVRVEVPIQVPCGAPEVAIPTWATGVLRKSDSLEVKVRALLAERRQRIAYETELVVATSACR